PGADRAAAPAVWRGSDAWRLRGRSRCPGAGRHTQPLTTSGETYPGAVAQVFLGPDSSVEGERGEQRLIDQVVGRVVARQRADARDDIEVAVVERDVERRLASRAVGVGMDAAARLPRRASELLRRHSGQFLALRG